MLRRLSAVTYEVQDFDPASRKKKTKRSCPCMRMKPYHDPAEQIETEDIPPKESYKGPITRSASSFSREQTSPDSRVLDESRSFFRVHTGEYLWGIKAEFIASWACSQSNVVSSSKR
ncbi:hypothetical protein TNCV_1041951 [Trichonephila clavipes]|nr:hypothetical protein TNCV_1041951 [Trichonephila clavipes]